MDGAIIRAVLDLGLRLLDTTTGRPVAERFCLFYRNGGQFNPDPRGDGIYVLVNTGREDFDLTIEVKGYETVTLPVRYAELEERMPFIDVHLIPLDNLGQGMGMSTLRGRLKGIISIEAIRLDRPCVNVSSYNERRQYIVLMATEGHYRFDDDRYALLDEDRESYQYLFPGTERDKESYNLARPLEREFYPNSDLYRIIRGMVRGDEYLLRVRSDGAGLPYMIRYETEEEVHFLILNLSGSPDAESLIT